MTKIVGYVLTSANVIKKCPKCGAYMEIDFNVNPKDTIFDILKDKIKNLVLNH